MRLGCFTDPHNADIAPRRRRESYTQDILDKQAFLIEPFRKCDVVLCQGDIFHEKKAHKISHKLVNSIMEIYREYPKMYIVVGNHDIDGRMDWKDRPLGTIGKLPNVEVLHGSIDVVDGVRFLFWGGGDLFSKEDTVEWLDAARKWKTDEEYEFTVAVMHSSVVGSAEWIPYMTVPFKEISKYASLFVLGHIHDYTSCTSRIIAPGSLSRGVLTLDEKVDRKIYYGIVEISGDSVVSKELIDVPHKSVEEVFKMDVKKAEVKQELAVESFKSVIEDLGGLGTMDRASTIKHIHSLEDIPVEVRNKAVNILEVLI